MCCRKVSAAGIVKLGFPIFNDSSQHKYNHRSKALGCRECTKGRYSFHGEKFSRVNNDQSRWSNLAVIFRREAWEPRIRQAVT